ncbi:MAG TPA: Zn-dependent alcohol dehydrogenase [Thermoanaerobaculia bacterium]|nr:Zn-dependent alcohol dehydrogenase [Thermoanaerobaculia bacterium]
MRAAVLHQVGQPLEIEEVAVDHPGPREVLIRTAATGVCHSDLHFVDGLWPCPLPIVLGHESAGVVEAVGSLVGYVRPGDHVITCLSVFCGHCEHCLSGNPARCGGRETDRAAAERPRLQRAGGEAVHQFAHLSSFAEQMLVHENAVVKIRDDMPLDCAALIGCAVMTGVGAVFRTARVEPGSMVAVIGCGGVGLSAINGAELAGASRIFAVDLVPAKLELARRFGATDIIDARAGDPVEAIRELTGGGVHYAFEAIGLKQTAEQAWAMLRPGGTATIIGMVPYGMSIEIPAHQLLAERKLQGCSMGSNRFRVDMPRFVDFYLAGKLRLDDLLERRVALDDVNGALQSLKTGEVARQVIAFDGLA